MKPRNVFKVTGMAVGALIVGFWAIGLTTSPIKWMQTTRLESLGVTPLKVQAGPFVVQEVENNAYQIAKGIRPAAKGESPEEAQLEKLPPSIPPGQLRRPSKAELLDKCMKNPRCREKVQEAKQKGPQKPLPAAREESPEEKELKNLPKPVNPKVRGQQPRSDLIMPNNTQTLLSWLNPFQVEPAYAQSAVSIFLTPGGPYTSGSYLSLYGARVYYNNRFYFAGYDTFTNPNAENKPFAFFRLSVPATGTYLINVQATRGKAKLRHQSSGPIIDTWDFTAQPYGTYDYLTAEYLEQGIHYFYFWPDASSFYLYSTSLESYS